MGTKRFSTFLIKHRSGILTGCVLALAFSIHLFLGLSRLPYYAGVDEPYWFYDRVPNFWSGLKTGNLEQTNINDKPGITVAWVSGLGLPWADPIGFKARRDADTEHAVDPVPEMLATNTALRLPILLATSFLLFAFYWLVLKLLGRDTALFSFVILALSPVILGASLFVNPDSLFWTFLPLTILSFLVYQKEGRKNYLYLSGLLLGLSLLTKYVANIAYVFLLALIFFEYILDKDSRGSLPKYLARSLRDFACVAAISLFTFLIFFPATWIQPQLLLTGTILSRAFASTWPLFLGLVALLAVDTFAFKNKFADAVIEAVAPFSEKIVKLFFALILLVISAVLANTYLGMPWFDFETILASPKSSLADNGFLGLVLADFWGLVFGIAPLLLASILFLLVKNITAKGKLERKGIAAFYFLLFILLYYAASTANGISASIRYQIVLFPFASILAAMGLAEMMNGKLFKKYLCETGAALLLVAILLASLLAIRPFYFAYASSLLPQKYVLNLKDMGDGSYEAAMYLNSLPGAKDLTVWSDKGGVCDFFIGNCQLGLDKNKLGNPETDYFVISAGRQIRSTASATGSAKRVIKALYAAKEPAYSVVIGGRENDFVKVISAEDIRK